MNTHLLKKYQTEIKNYESELLSLEDDRNNLNNKINKVRSSLAKTKNAIENLKEKDIVITEHALIRYFERHLKYDLDEIKNNLLNDQTKYLAKFSNGAKIKIPWEGKHLVFKDNTLVTIED